MINTKQMKYILFLTVLFIFCSGISSLTAQSSTLIPVADIYFDNSGGVNDGSLKIRNIHQSRAYLRFDLGSISGNIQSAQLKLTIKSNPNAGAVNIYRCPSASSTWTEGTLFTSSTIPSFNKPADQLNTNVVSQTTTTNVPYTWELDVSKLSTGGSLTIAVEKAVNASNLFYTRTHSVTQYRPQLIITTGGATPTCNDGIQNGDETGVDCGGSNCTACPTLPTCNDGIQNGDETGIDCGGSNCAACPTTPTCGDGIQNGDESGVDCGGSNCSPCNSGGSSVNTLIAPTTLKDGAEGIVLDIQSTTNGNDLNIQSSGTGSGRTQVNIIPDKSDDRAFLNVWNANDVDNRGMVRLGARGNYGILSATYAGTLPLEKQTKSIGIELDPNNTITGETFQVATGGWMGASWSQPTVLFHIQEDGNVGIGTTTPTAKLTVAGDAHIRKVKITVDAGADFVFQNGYEPPALEEVAAFVEANEHLPGIASEKEMLEEGVDVGKFNIQLLQKIEEMTLYMIDFQEQMKQLQAENETLKAEVKALKSRER